MARLLQTYQVGNLSVTFEPRRCIHAAACIRAQPEVFVSAARPWIRLERGAPEGIIEAVLRCPTGALRAYVGGEAVEIDAEPVVLRTMRHGPLVVRGALRVVAEDGAEIVTDRRVALCRCGKTGRPPFCDNSHRDAGFRDPAP